jgi:hypothetical protein
VPPDRDRFRPLLADPVAVVVVNYLEISSDSLFEMADLRTTWRFVALLALGAVGFRCGNGPPLVSPEGATLSISANPTTIPLVGGESTITVIGFRGAADGGGTLPNGTHIFFTTTVGVIEERVAMNDGIARATLRSTGRAGTASVTARSGNGVATEAVEVRIGFAGDGTRIVLTANPTTVVAPDFTSELVATAFDQNNNPLRDVPIIFTTTAGALASRGSIIRTNANGQAVDRLTLANESSATVTAISGSVSSNAVTVGRGTQIEPILTSLSPSVGAPGQSLTVTINGLNFQPGATASFGTGISVNGVDFVSSTAVRAHITISPSASEGERTVTLTNPDGGSGDLVDGFLVSLSGGIPGVSPTVTAVAPPNANQGDNLVLTITGMNFQPGAQVSFTPGGIVINSVNVVSATQIQANISVSGFAAAGDRDVTVVNPGGASDTLASAFLVIAPPTVSQVTPLSGNPGQMIVSVEINGANFQSGATVSFGAGITVSPPLFVDPTILFVDITISGTAVPGPRDVTVTNPDGGTDTLVGGFTVN